MRRNTPRTHVSTHPNCMQPSESLRHHTRPSVSLRQHRPITPLPAERIAQAAPHPRTRPSVSLRQHHPIVTSRAHRSGNTNTRHPTTLFQEPKLTTKQLYRSNANAVGNEMPVAWNPTPRGCHGFASTARAQDKTNMMTYGNRTTKKPPMRQMRADRCQAWFKRSRVTK